VWFVPLLVVAGCAAGLLLSIRRWSTPLSRTTAATGVDGPGSVDGEARRYEDLLDRELQRRG